MSSKESTFNWKHFRMAKQEISTGQYIELYLPLNNSLVYVEPGDCYRMASHQSSPECNSKLLKSIFIRVVNPYSSIFDYSRIKATHRAESVPITATLFVNTSSKHGL